MCGRFSFCPENVKERFGEEFSKLYKPRYNIAPQQDHPIILPYGEVRMGTWGFQPEWADHLFINARKESLEKPFYKKMMKNRCLIPADGYYEWIDKKPYRITLKNNEPFAFAGIYEIIDNKPHFLIITLEPNDYLKEFKRMPAILKEEKMWISEIPEIILKKQILIPYPDEMRKYRVSKKVNNPKNDEPSVIEPASSLDDF